MTKGPSKQILDAFRAAAKPRRLAGGQGNAFRAGSLILKPVDDPVEASRTADLFDRLSGPGFQVPRPARSAEGTWIVNGWCAWRRFQGQHVTGRWLERLEVCDQFHAALAPEPRPAFLDTRTDPWSIADRMCWGEEPIECLPSTRASVDRLLPLLTRNAAPSQLIHGDIAGNILFAPGESPCVIDFSPYWRPAWFAKAVLVVDAIVWSRASPALVQNSGLMPGMLARAALRRILEHDLHHRLRGRDTLGDVRHYEIIVSALSSMRLTQT